MRGNGKRFEIYLWNVIKVVLIKFSRSKTIKINETPCAVSYHLYCIKNVKKNPWRNDALLLHGCFSRFLNLCRCIKLRKTSQIGSVMPWQNKDKKGNSSWLFKIGWMFCWFWFLPDVSMLILRNVNVSSSFSNVIVTAITE